MKIKVNHGHYGITELYDTIASVIGLCPRLM